MKNRFFYIATFFSILFLAGCIKDSFDEPPVSGQDPNIPEEAIVSLEEVQDLYISGEYVKLDLDKYVSAVVVADDASGSFYKTLVVEDENSDLGISVLIDENNLAARYPIGRRVFIHLKNLWIGDFAGTPQLGYGPYDDDGQDRMAQIPGPLAQETIIIGEYNQPVTPEVIDNLNLLGGSKLNTLIQLNGVEFSDGDIGTTYADPINNLSENKTLVDCDGNTITVRNSGFATFAGEFLPEGNGSLIGIYTIFANTKQLIIRSPEDLDFSGARCGAGGPTGEKITIAEIRDAYNTGAVSGPDGYIEGVVISDGPSGNTTFRNMVIQDNTAGIVVRFEDNHDYSLGDKVTVNVKSMELSEFRGVTQINEVPASRASKVGTETPTAITISIGDILQDFDVYESRLVKIENPNVSGGATWATDVTINDGTGEMSVFTRNTASFANENIPDEIKSLVGIVGEFSDGNFNPQLTLRNADDIDGEGGTGGGPTEGIEEAFNGGSDNQDIDIENWENIASAGERKWQKKSFMGNGYAQATAFNDMNPEMEAWLISPEIDATKYNNCSFETAQAFYRHEGLTVWATDNYTGDPLTTTWTELEDADLAGSSSDEHAWVASGTLDISSFGNKARVAFKYNGSGGNNTTSYRIDNVVIK